MDELDDKEEIRKYRFNYKRKVSRDLLFLLEKLKSINSDICISFIKNYGLNKELFLMKTDYGRYNYTDYEDYDEDDDEVHLIKTFNFEKITNLTNSVFYKVKYCFLYRVNINNSLFALTKFFKDKVKIANHLGSSEEAELSKNEYNDIDYKDVVITIKNYNKKPGARHRIMKNYYHLTSDAYKFAKEGKPQYDY